MDIVINKVKFCLLCVLPMHSTDTHSLAWLVIGDAKLTSEVVSRPLEATRSHFRLKTVIVTKLESTRLYFQIQNCFLTSKMGDRTRSNMSGGGTNFDVWNSKNQNPKTHNQVMCFGVFLLPMHVSIEKPNGLTFFSN